jgi:phage gpG-like protein
VIVLDGLHKADDRLANLDVPGAVATAIAAAARDLEAKVKEILSLAPGQDHSVPWLRTGALRASINHETDGNMAVIGSASDVAVDQEFGTAAIPPRSFLASTASAEAECVVACVADAIAQALAARS